MSCYLSEDAAIYYNTGTYAAPGWLELSEVQNVTLNLTNSPVDVTTRASNGFVERCHGLIDAGVSFTLLYDPTDPGVQAVKNAFFNKTALEFAVLDKTIANSGQGLRAHMMVGDFTRNENLGEALSANVTIQPVANSNAAPAWVTSNGTTLS